VTGEQPTPPKRTEQRQFTLGARIWVLALAVLAGALVFVGQSAVAIGAIAVGIIGFLVVFNARRPWWGPGLRATTASGRPPADRRTTFAFAVALGLVTIVSVAFFLLSDR
jgi:hypothetical protein